MNKTTGNHINKNIIYITAFLLITLISLFYKLFLSGTFDAVKNNSGSGQIEVITETTESSAAAEETEPVLTNAVIDVYICGEVNEPGVYEVEAGSIVNDVVELAGGLTDEASVNRINLVYIIDSNMSIYIPYEGEECEEDPVIRQDNELVWGSSADTDPGESSGGLVNINTATLEQLMTLPGIGEVTANAIIEYREQAYFERVEDIMNVTGIGEAKFNGIRDLICV